MSGKTPYRLMNPDGSLNIRRVGHHRVVRSDLYYLMRTTSWPRILGGIALVYATSCAVFAFAYVACGDCISSADPGSYRDAFFFSVQTMSTIGYGTMSPVGSTANAIVTVEAIFSLLFTAVSTGLVFAKFATPTAQVMFSNVAVICPMNGVPTLTFRVANQRFTHIVEAHVRLTVLLDTMTDEGTYMRRFYDLDLVRSSTPIFALSWSVMHPITDQSPLYGFSDEDLQDRRASLVITLRGIDDTTAAQIHTRHAYDWNAIRCGMKFVDILEDDESGIRSVRYDRFHDIVSV